MSNVLISIIVPIYNVEQYLPRCVDSILAQTYQNIELILVDDGSLDGCGALCDEYAVKDARVKVIHKMNAGVTDARITGYECCMGDYVAFVDSDDNISQNYIEHLFGIIKEYHVAISCCQLYNQYGNKLKADIRSEKGFYDRKRIEKMLKTDFLFDYKQKKPGIFLGLCGKLFEKELLKDALPVAKGLWMGEDLISFMYMLYKFPSIYISEEPLYYYTQHSMQATRQAGLPTWYNQVAQWNRIIELDKHGFMSDQLAYRMLRFFQHFIKENIKVIDSYENFKIIVYKALQPTIVNRLLVHYHYDSLTMVDNVFIYSIRNNFLICIYYVGKLLLKLEH